MPRKTQKSSETMGSEFATRLRNLLEDRGMNQSQLAAATSLQRQTISNYVLGQSVPDGDNLIKLSIALDVSVDYLLGLSDNPSPDASLKGACEYTGLSEKAITNLANMSKNNNGWYRGSLSAVLESSSFQKLIEVFSDSIEASCDVASAILFLDSFENGPHRLGINLSIETQMEKLQDLYYSLNNSIRELYGMKYAISEAAVALYGEIQDLDALERDLRRVKDTFDLDKALELLKEGAEENEKEDNNGLDKT